MLGLGGLDRRAIAVVAMGLLLLVPAVPALAPAADGAPWFAWRVETVDDGHVRTDSTGIGLGPDGDLHLVYRIIPPNDFGALGYAHRIGLDWHTEIVDTVAGNGNIDVDSEGEPHMVYRRNRDRNEVAYATPDGAGAWSIETVDPLGVGTPVIAISPHDDVHVLYEKSDGPDDDVRFATRSNDGTWSIETIHHASMFTSDLVIDSAGSPHAVYALLEDPEDLIRYATKDDQGQWVTELLPDCRFWVGIDVDVLDRPHVACWGVDGLQYHTHDGQDWVQETVSDGSNLVPPRASIDTGQEPSIAVDSQLTPHISFNLRPNLFFPDDPTARGELHYATKVDGEWSIEVADRDGYKNGRASDIVVDDQDRPHISYVLGVRFDRGSCGDIQNTCFDLRYATPLVGSAASAIGR